MVQLMYLLSKPLSPQHGVPPHARGLFLRLLDRASRQAELVKLVAGYANVLLG
jgi:hypothetical protein